MTHIFRKVNDIEKVVKDSSLGSTMLEQLLCGMSLLLEGSSELKVPVSNGTQRKTVEYFIGDDEALCEALPAPPSLDQLPEDTFVDASTQRSPCDLVDYSPTLDAAQQVLDEVLGYQDQPLPRPELRCHAEVLLKRGLSIQDVKSECANHDLHLNSLRERDTLTRLCGERWTMRGINGRIYISKSNRIRVDRVLPGGGSAVCSDPGAGTFGNVDLVEHLFTIEHF